jgi:hypothetical protein
VRTFAEPSIAYLRKLADSPDATAQHLIEAIRGTAECGVEPLRDYPAALRYAIRARDLTQGKDASVLAYLAEAYGLNHDYANAVEAARQGLAATGSAHRGRRVLGKGRAAAEAVPLLRRSLEQNTVKVRPRAFA